MLGILVQIDAQDAAGSALPLRLASHDVPELCHLGGEEWDPALTQLPDFALDFFGGAFAGQVTAPRTGFAAMSTGLSGFSSVPANRARFADARVRIWVGDFTSSASADLGPLTLRFDGRLTGEPEIDDTARVARFEAAVQDSWADEPLLGLFAGSGGIEGPQDLEGQPKPLALGNIRFARGVLIDNVDNVWMVSDGAVEGIGVAYDRLASLGASSGDHADLAALLAASIPNGSWATAKAQGLVRTGAPPDGRVSFDVAGSNAGTGGYVRTPGAMIRRIADLAGGTVNAASLTALDSARPYNLQLQIGEQTTAREVIARIADSVAAVAGVSLTGELFAQALGFGTASETLNADGTSALAVLSVEELAKAAPSWKLATEAELTFELHSADEAAFGYRWQGEYSATRVYRIDDVVAGPDGAAWAYINAAPAAGQALPVWPTSSNSHWELFQAPAGASIAPANANRVPFSRFEGGRGWQATGDFNPAPFLILFDGRYFICAEPTFTAANQNVYLLTSPRIPVLPNERLSVSARVQAFALPGGLDPNFWQLYLEYVDASGTLIGGATTTISTGNTGMNESVLHAAFSTAPSNARTAQLVLRYQSSGAGPARLAILEPMIASAAAGQTVHPDYTPGPNASDGADPNSDITVVGGILDGIGTPGINVDNRGVVLSGLLAARPASGAYIGQTYTATDTLEFYRWDGFNWQTASDVTATAQRTIEPQFPVIEIKQGEAGHTGTRTVTHVAKRGTATLTGGTWSLPSTNVTSATITINSGTGTVSLSSVAVSGAYTVRYTHTDGIATDLPVNVTYVPSVAAGVGSIASSITKPFASTSFVAISNDMQIQLPSGVTVANLLCGPITLEVPNALPAGNTNVEVKWQRETTPGTWADVGAAAAASPQPGVIDEGGFPSVLFGSVTCNRTATGLTAGSTQKFRLVARVSGGTTRTVTPFGTVSAGG